MFCLLRLKGHAVNRLKITSRNPPRKIIRRCTLAYVYVGCVEVWLTRGIGLSSFDWSLFQARRQIVISFYSDDAERIAT